jgi:Fe-S-cluster containining protein
MRQNGEAMASASRTRASSPRPSPPPRGGEGEERQPSRPLRGGEGEKRQPCDGCDARCCSSYAVHVTGEDAFRIARGTGLDMARFLAFRPQVERTDAGFLLERGAPTHDLVLETARTDDARKACLFLERDAATGEGRCGIYALRPGACRRFPAVRLDDREGGGRVAVREGIVCPDGAWDCYPIDRLSWRVALAREGRDAELYAVVVGEWNARIEASRPNGPRTFEQFLDRLSDVYAWLAHLRRALPPRDCAGPGLLLRVGDALRELPGS